MRRLAALVLFCTAVAAAVGASPFQLAVVRSFAKPQPVARAYSQRVDGSPAHRLPDGAWLLTSVDITPREHPLDRLNADELEHVVFYAPEHLGPASIGRPNRGWLHNGIAIPERDFWQIVRPENSWGTPVTVRCLERAVAHVARQFPHTPKLLIGDLSRRTGGFLRRHRSHQSGRDADLGFYYVDDSVWYTKATAKNLDVPRNWALIRALLTKCDVEYIFVDRFVMDRVHEHATALGEDPEWLAHLFKAKRFEPAVIRHAWGHRTHIHVRIHDNEAVETGARVEAFLRTNRLAPTAIGRGPQWAFVRPSPWLTEASRDLEEAARSASLVSHVLASR